jgi:hypothetical protein
LTVIAFVGAAWSKPWTIPLVTKSRTLSGSLIWNTLDQGHESSAQRRAASQVL